MDGINSSFRDCVYVSQILRQFSKIHSIRVFSNCFARGRGKLAVVYGKCNKMQLLTFI